MSKSIKICLYPNTNEFPSICERYEKNRCGMCPGVNIAVKQSEIEEMIIMLGSSGINSKQQVADKLKSYLK